MPSSYTSSLRLTLPATGENNGTWGQLVNDGITTLIDTAVAGYVSIAMSDADYTLTNVNGNTDEARRAILNMTGTLTAARNVICPTASKVYIFKNATTGGFAVTLKTSGGTGVSVPNGETRLLYCDGTNVVTAISNLGSVTSVSGTGTVNGITLTGTVTSSGSLTLGGTLSNVNLTSQVTSTLPAANGGTGQSSYTVGDILYASGATTLAKLAAVATGNVLISNGAAAAPSWGKVGLTTNVSGTLPVANGGTGAATLTGLVVGNGASAFTTVTAPSGTVVGTTDTQTLTNKRVNPRVSSTTSITSPLAWNSDNFDLYAATAQATNLTFNADSGSPVDGQKIIFRIKDNGTPVTLTWTTGTAKSFRAIGVTLPTTTSSNKTVYVGCVYNSADTRWDAVGVAQEA